VAKSVNDQSNTKSTASGAAVTSTVQRRAFERSLEHEKSDTHRDNRKRAASLSSSSDDERDAKRESGNAAHASRRRRESRTTADDDERSDDSVEAYEQYRAERKAKKSKPKEKKKAKRSDVEKEIQLDAKHVQVDTRAERRTTRPILIA
jgi:hypothetical protein